MTTLLSRLRSTRRVVRRTVLRRRRLLAGLLAAAATVAGVRAAQPPPASSERVLVAAHDLDAGTVVMPADLRRARYAEGTVPAGVPPEADAVGRTLAAPLRAGEPLTDVRLVGAGVLAGYPGLVALPLRIPDADVVALLRVGDLVDVLATDPRGGSTARVASGVPVLALPATRPDDLTGATTSAGEGLTGRLVLVGIPAARAPLLAGASVGRFLSVTLLR